MDNVIIYEDDSLMVLSKPSMITVNRSDTTKGEKTVQDWIETKVKSPACNCLRKAMAGRQKSKVKNDEDSEFYQRAGIVHRLDKETSGILLVAKTKSAFEDLQRQFKERSVKKTYITLVHGKVEPSTGEIRVPVGRLPWNRKRFGVIPGGRDAVTKYNVLSQSVGKEPLSLLEIYPETGRTHQIRVHLKHLGYPIFGDILYAGRKTSRKDRKVLPRIFLHANSISFRHPTSGKTVSFNVILPKELEGLLKSLGANSAKI